LALAFIRKVCIIGTYRTAAQRPDSANQRKALEEFMVAKAWQASSSKETFKTCCNCKKPELINKMDAMEYDPNQMESNLPQNHPDDRHDMIILCSVMVVITSLIALGFSGLLP
jgi:hypothetical protein